MKTKFSILLVLLIVTVTVAACGVPASNAAQGEAISVLTREEATAMINNAMQAFNTGDYATWSHDWDNDMKAAIKEKDFLAYRDQVLAQYGQYVSLESVELQPGQQKGNARWVAIAYFEKGKIKFSFGLPNGARLIRGIFPEAVN